MVGSEYSSKPPPKNVILCLRRAGSQGSTSLSQVQGPAKTWIGCLGVIVQHPVKVLLPQPRPTLEADLS